MKLRLAAACAGLQAVPRARGRVISLYNDQVMLPRSPGLQGFGDYVRLSEPKSGNERALKRKGKAKHSISPRASICKIRGKNIYNETVETFRQNTKETPLKQGQQFYGKSKVTDNRIAVLLPLRDNLISQTPQVVLQS